MLAVPPDHWEAFQVLCSSEGVEATIIGRFTQSGRLTLKYGDVVVGDLPMSFLHDGRPAVLREATYAPPATRPLRPTPRARYNDALLRILASLNVCSKEWIIRQYDHEVQSGSVVKPLVGVHDDGPSDAAVVRPDLRSNRGIVVACGMNPRYGDFDTYWMAASAIDEAVRNCICVGADPRRIAILDNFCWGNTERPEVLGSLVRAALACRDVAIAWSTPFISGKDSLNNEFSYVDASGQRRSVSIPPSLLISALGQIDDVSHALTMDLKNPGNLIYLAGQTHDELGGSHFALVDGLEGGTAPRVDVDGALKLFQAVHAAIASNCVRSCHDLSEGGLAAAAAEMAFAGDWGLSLDLGGLRSSSGLDDVATLLFSESNSRFLLEVPEELQSKFESHLDGLPLTLLGRVTAAKEVVFTDGKSRRIDCSVADLKAAWKSGMHWD